VGGRAKPGHDTVGAGGDTVGAGQDTVGADHDTVGDGRATVGDGHDTVGDGHDTHRNRGYSSLPEDCLAVGEVGGIDGDEFQFVFAVGL
jgi:hypothetical protein